MAIKTLFAYHPQNLDQQINKTLNGLQKDGHKIEDLNIRKLFDNEAFATLFIAEIAYTPIQELSTGA